MNDSPDVATLIAGLEADNEATRKYAIFRLQTLLADPSFADAFVQGDGLAPLKLCVLDTTGNAQAYALGGFDALLQLDMGWDAVDAAVIEKAVSLAVTHPLVNIVRNALTLLVLIVSRRPQTASEASRPANAGFQAIKPALDHYPDFLESLVQRLSASDHTLCANALRLVNALMRDAVTNGGESEWPRFIKRLQDLGVIGGVGMLMRSEAAGDPTSPLATAILEFQALTKLLLRKWRSVKVNVELSEHKRALKTIHLLSKPEPYHQPQSADSTGRKGSRKHHPEKWRRLGFESESPAWEFDETGYLGVMDLVEFVRRNEDAYQKILMEQAVQSRDQRCPLARASMSVTLILFEHFEIDDTPGLDAPLQSSRATATPDPANAASANVDKAYRPLLLQWGRLHTAALDASMRLWRLSGAEADDFYKIEELVRIVVERVVGAADRRTEIARVEDQLRTVSLDAARSWQMEGLDEVYDDAWGPHLVQVRDQLYHESLQFMKEQRIRCLLRGSWFPVGESGPGAKHTRNAAARPWRYVRLSHNRRLLHYQDYVVKHTDAEVPLSDLPRTIDLNAVTSVDSNVSASDPVMTGAATTAGADDASSISTMHDPAHHARQKSIALPPTTTRITILGRAASTPSTSERDHNEESALLELLPQSPNLASEWLDGLLLLLNQQPITKTTTSLITMMADWGVRLRMLNLRWEDVDWDALEARVKGVKLDAREVPGREGVDEDFWYAMAEK